MTPVKQEFLHDPANGSFGDCQRAVIASLMDLPISEVPHFYEISKGDSDDFFTAIQDFLNPRGYAYLTVSRGGGILFGEVGAVYHEILGQSPRDPRVLHCVVGMNGHIVHDPHPDNAGLAGDPSTWQYSYIVKTNLTKNKGPRQ